MIKIHSINMESDTFDEVLKNLQSGGVFVRQTPQQKNQITSENPTIDELQSRVKMLKTRFEKFKENQKKLGVKDITFEYQSFGKQLENLNPTQNDFKNLVENAEKTMQELENDINLVNGFVNPKEASKDELKEYIKRIFSSLDNDTKNQVKAIVIKKINQIEK